MSTKSPIVQEFCTGLWDIRAAGRLKADAVGKLSRLLINAAAEDMAVRPDYEPLSDLRFLWAMGVLDAARRREPVPKASGDLEAMAAFSLEREEAVVVSGKDLAAGDFG